MLWSDKYKAAPGLALACMLSLTAAGCFQPIYAENPSLTTNTISGNLSQVEVLPIDGKFGQEDEARIGIELRNTLIFALNGNNTSPSPTHSVKITLRGTTLVPLSDKDSGRPEAETYTLDARYALTDLKTGKIVHKGEAFARVSFDTPGQQRFARLRGMRDAQDRSAKVIAEQIRGKLTNFFASIPAS